MNNKKFDICFIDGDHLYKAVTKDIDLCLSHLKKDGLLMLDDYWLNCNEKFRLRPVMDAVNQKLLYKYKFLFLIRSVIIFQNNVNYKHYDL